MMRAYCDARENHFGFHDCADPLGKHSTILYLYGNGRVEPPRASKEDIDYCLHELAYILERARPLNYIEIANTFPISCQSLVAQFEEYDPKTRVVSGVTHFRHTRVITMCICCLTFLQDKIRKFQTENPDLFYLLNKVE